MHLRMQVYARRPFCRRSSPAAHLLAVAVMAALAAPAAAQLQFEDLRKRGLPATMGYTVATAFGDVDGDGDLDLVVANDWKILLYLNDGAGTFTDETASRMPGGLLNTTGLQFGDLDGDGDLDLVVACSGQTRVYQNNGTGTFVDVTATSLPIAGLTTYELALGDFDGDGDLDMVLGNDRGQQSRLYLNNGAGIFTDATAGRFPVGYDHVIALAVGDVDGDGDLDLIFAMGDFSRRRSHLYLNDGTGTFTDATAMRMPVGTYEARSVALGDVDGDGDLDLVVGTWDQQSRLYLNAGTGFFTDETAMRMPVGTYHTRSIVFGDVDGDGHLDLILGNYEQQSRLYLNNGGGVFVDATVVLLPARIHGTTGLLLGDVDGDGDLDLVVKNFTQQTLLYLNSGRGQFVDATASPMPAFVGTNALALGDVDGDGDLDLVVGGGGAGPAQRRLFLNDGRGMFHDVTSSRMPNVLSITTALLLGDVDGDGDLDLVIGDQNRQVLLYLNDGTGSFTDVTGSRMPLGSPATSLAMGDVDGDGDLDLVLGAMPGGAKYGQCRLYLNNGLGTFVDATTTRMPFGSFNNRSVALGDVDGDGDLDLVLGNIGNQAATASSNRLYLNDGTGRFVDASIGRLPAVGNDPTSSLVFGDVDGDGDLDLVLGSAGEWYSRWIQNKYGGYWSHSLIPGQSRLYLNNGAGVFSDATTTHLPVARYTIDSLALGDLDGDGDLDMVLGNSYFTGGSVRIYLNNGTGRFVDVTTQRIPDAHGRTRAVVLGDLDGDGDLDLTLGTQGERHHYRNMLRQLDAPFMLQTGRTYQLDIYSRYSPVSQAEIAFPFFSTATVRIPLPPVGTLAIDPSQMVVLPPVLVPQPSGMVSLGVPVPNLPALAGITIYTQALLQQLPVQMRLTNAVGDTILR